MEKYYLKKYQNIKKRFNIGEQDHDFFKVLINKNISETVNKYYEHPIFGDTTLLCYAALSGGGDIKLVKYLIRKGADVNQADGVVGNTPLIWSVLYFHIDLIKYLMSHSADSHLKNFQEQSAIESALASGNNDILPHLVLIRKNTRQNYCTKILSRIIFLKKCVSKVDQLTQNCFGNTEIHGKASKWSSQDLKSLIRNKSVNVNITNDYGETPLHIAVLKRRRSSVKILLNNGADVNRKDIDGATPVHVAVAKNKHGRNGSIIHTLLKNNANLNIKNISGQSPLQFAFDNEDFESVKDIVKNLRIGDPYIIEALRLAVDYESIDTVKSILIKFENSGSLKHHDGDDVLHYTIRKNKLDIVREMIEYVDINLQNDNGDTALHLAVYYELNEIVGLLLSENVDVTIQNKQGDTALHLAIEANLSFFIVLVDRVDISIQNQDGDTALHLATKIQ